VTRLSRLVPLLALLRHVAGPIECLLIGEDKKWLAWRQTDAIDPKRKWRCPPNQSFVDASIAADPLLA
jgi:hypothetical protein